MTIRAALLDEQGLFLRIDTLADASQLTPRHLPGITECDLPPGRYKFMPSQDGRPGTFVPLEALDRAVSPTLNDAFANLCAAVAAAGIALPPATQDYLEYLGRRSARRNAKRG